jgi:PEP-CTERM/exosortase A-associated glycosyltransferase
MRALRVLHVLDHSLPSQTGYVYRTLGILGAQRSFGWQTFQLTTPRYHGEAPPEETVDGWTFLRTAKPRTPLASRPVIRELAEMEATRRRLDRVIAELKPDLVHAHSPILTGLPAWRAARRARIPIVYEVRALWEDAAVDIGHAKQSGLRYRTTRALETMLLQRANGVVTLCESMRGELASRGIAGNKTVVVPNAVDMTHFSGARERDENLAESLSLKDRVVLGFIGSFYHYEGLDLLLRALPEIRKEIPNAVVLLVGGGPQEAMLKDLTVVMGLSDAVRFTGRVPHEKVRLYYDLVDFFVYPRKSMRLTELVTPLKPLEAMAERRLVIASDVGGHRELIRDGVTGYLFKADDPSALARRVIEAVRGTQKHDAMREAGRRFIETDRNWIASASHYRGLYRGILRRPIAALVG